MSPHAHKSDGLTVCSLSDCVAVQGVHEVFMLVRPGSNVATKHRNGAQGAQRRTAALYP